MIPALLTDSGHFNSLHSGFADVSWGWIGAPKLSGASILMDFDVFWCIFMTSWKGICQNAGISRKILWNPTEASGRRVGVADNPKTEQKWCQTPADRSLQLSIKFAAAFSLAFCAPGRSKWRFAWSRAVFPAFGIIFHSWTLKSRITVFGQKMMKNKGAQNVSIKFR